MSAPKTLHDLIDEAHGDLQFGTISFTLKKAQGNVVTVDTTRITRRKVSGNANALTIIGSMLKMLGEAGVTGDLTFTVSLEKGDSTQLMTHDFTRRNLKGDTYQ